MFHATTRAARAEALDDLLSRWHHWQQSSSVGRGYDDHSAVVGQFRTSRQYDDDNGALYEDEEHELMRAVDFAVRELAGEHGAALHQQARALMLGVDVFRSPRLPADPAARAQLLGAAREMLMERLAAAGVL